MTSSEQLRQITDSKVLAAMAHPLRRRLMDVLQVHGPATVSVLAERTGQRVPNISHHLRVLAEVELVEDAPELARDRRERWWRLRSRSLRWNSTDFADEPAAAAVAHAAMSLELSARADAVRAWLGADEDERASWGRSGFTADKWLHLTPDELDALTEEVVDLLDRWASRSVPEDDRVRRPVLVFAYGVPAQP